jgi:hypothetical protein
MDVGGGAGVVSELRAGNCVGAGVCASWGVQVGFPSLLVKVG